MLYTGKKATKLQNNQKKQQLQQTRQQTKLMISEMYEKFQLNLSQFLRDHQSEINSNANFRDRFGELCQKFDVNPMLAEKSIWSSLGFGNFYQQLLMKVLDICAKNRTRNAGLMRIQDILVQYHRKEATKITQQDVVRAVSKAHLLGNISIVNGDYVCTVPMELTPSLNLLLNLAGKYGFVSATLLRKEKMWSEEEFELQMSILRRKGIVWVDKQTKNNPHYYFLSHFCNNFDEFKISVKQF